MTTPPEKTEIDLSQQPKTKDEVAARANHLDSLAAAARAEGHFMQANSLEAQARHWRTLWFSWGKTYRPRPLRGARR